MMEFLKKLLPAFGGKSSTPADAGKEVAMSDQTTANPPAASGGVTLEQLKTFFGEAMKPISEGISALQKGYATLTETSKAHAEAISKIPQSAKPEDVAKLVTEQLTAQNKAQADAQAKAAARAELVKGVAAAKLPGVPASFLKLLPDTDDETALEKAADELRASFNGMGAKLADVGGAASSAANGGTTPAASQPEKKTGFLRMANEAPMPAATAAATGAAK